MVGVMVIPYGSVVAVDMVVNPVFPHSHTDHARGKERGVVHVPPSPLHKAHVIGSKDPSYGGYSKTCYLAVGPIDEQDHGGCLLG